MFRIIVDSAANIPAVTVKQYGIEVISFVNEIDGHLLTCFDPDLSPEEENTKGHIYYEAIRNGTSVKTGLVNTEDFEQHFDRALSAGEDVLCINLSRNISGTYNAARIAAEAMAEKYPDRKVRLVDSMNASLAQGNLAIYAAMLRDQGMDVDRAADLIQGAVLSMNGVFTVGDLRHLAHTGRVKTTTAIIGNMLSIKPILRGSAEGFIVEFSKCRGRRKSLDTLADLVCDNIIQPEKQIIGIAHADAWDDAQYVIERIRSRVQPKEFLLTSYDYCTGSHVGPDTIALFFIAEDRELKGRTGKPGPELLKYL